MSLLRFPRLVDSGATVNNEADTVLSYREGKPYAGCDRTACGLIRTQTVIHRHQYLWRRRLNPIINLYLLKGCRMMGSRRKMCDFMWLLQADDFLARSTTCCVNSIN